MYNLDEVVGSFWAAAFWYYTCFLWLFSNLYRKLAYILDNGNKLHPLQMSDKSELTCATAVIELAICLALLLLPNQWRVTFRPYPQRGIDQQWPIWLHQHLCKGDGSKLNSGDDIRKQFSFNRTSSSLPNLISATYCCWICLTWIEI